MSLTQSSTLTCQYRSGITSLLIKLKKIFWVTSNLRRRCKNKLANCTNSIAVENKTSVVCEMINNKTKHFIGYIVLMPQFHWLHRYAQQYNSSDIHICKAM